MYKYYWNRDINQLLSLFAINQSFFKSVFICSSIQIQKLDPQSIWHTKPRMHN